MPQPCPCSNRHSPPITEAETDVHHYPPLSWPMVDPSLRKTIRACATTHRRFHRLLNLYVHLGGPPPKSALRGFRPIELDAAAYAWEHADHSGSNHLPYTASG